MPLWQGPPLALLVSTSLDQFDCSDHQKVAELCPASILRLTDSQKSQWMALAQRLCHV